MSRKSAIRSTNLLRVCTDEAQSMIDRTAGIVALPESFFYRPLPKYRCIIHQVSPCGNFLICSRL